MSRRVLGIACSPRAGGNSDLLVQKALAGAESAGATLELIALRDLEIAPCQECNACLTSVCESDRRQGRHTEASLGSR